MRTFNKEEIESFQIVTLHTSGMRHVGEVEIVMKDGKAEVSRYGIRFTQEEDQRMRSPSVLRKAQMITDELNENRLLDYKK